MQQTAGPMPIAQTRPAATAIEPKKDNIEFAQIAKRLQSQTSPLEQPVKEELMRHAKVIFDTIHEKPESFLKNKSDEGKKEFEKLYSEFKEIQKKFDDPGKQLSPADEKRLVELYSTAREQTTGGWTKGLIRDIPHLMTAEQKARLVESVSKKLNGALQISPEDPDLKKERSALDAIIKNKRLSQEQETKLLKLGFDLAGVEAAKPIAPANQPQSNAIPLKQDVKVKLMETASFVMNGVNKEPDKFLTDSSATGKEAFNKLFLEFKGIENVFNDPKQQLSIPQQERLLEIYDEARRLTNGGWEKGLRTPPPNLMSETQVKDLAKILLPQMESLLKLNPDDKVLPGINQLIKTAADSGRVDAEVENFLLQISLNLEKIAPPVAPVEGPQPVPKP